MIFLKEAKDLRFIAFNRAGEELVGHDRRGLLGKNDQDLFPPEQAARFVAADREVLDGEAGMLDVPEEPLSTAKKGTRLLHTRKVRIRGADGTAKYLLGISEDITDRVEAATALQRQNGLLTTLLEVLPVGVMMVEAPSGKPLVVNEEARKLLGRGILSHASRENLGSVYEAFKEGSHDPYPETEMPLVRGLNGESAHVDDMIILRPDGTKTLLEVFGSPLRNPQGQVWASLVHFTDITVRRQEEKERHDSQQMSSNTLNSIRDHIIILDIRSHRILEANAAFLSDCGLTRQQVLGRTCYDVTHGLSVPCSAPDDHCPIEDMLASRTHVKTEHVHRSANGQERIVEVSVHPITNLDGTIHRVVHVSRDITDNKDKERTHIQLQKLESLGVLAGGIAHDFNNILTTILANISLLQSRGAVSGESLEWIEEAQAACGTAQGLARQLLTFAKGGSPVVEVVDLRPVLMQAAAFATRGSNARCIFDLGEDPLATSIDVDQVTQVVQNLVLNASQATPQGGDITIRARTADLGEREQVPLPAGCYILVSVADRGVGIAPEILSKVFDPYFSTKGVGRGLGLSACHSIMLRHGGIIRAESTLGVGAVFTLYFPAQASADIVREPVTPMLVVGSGRVLVMDDEASLAKVLRRLLTSLGYTADSVADGQAALDAYKAAMSSDNPYDAVILDLTIPGGLGGEETIAKLLELDPKVKAVVSSGYSDSTVVAESGKHGFLGTLAKPYGVADVSEVMRRLFESRTVT
jgi:PAS domain S-box-containing protein